MGPHSEDRVRVRRRRPFHESTRVVSDESESVSATFSCKLIKQMIRQLIEFCNDTPQAEQERFSQANARIHKAIINAVREHDVEKVPDRMIVQMTEAPRYV